MEVEIVAVFKGKDQEYMLYYSDLREQFQFKWANGLWKAVSRPEGDPVKDFKWFDTVREAMINASGWKPYMIFHNVNGKNDIIGVPVHDHDFLHFKIDGHIVTDLSFLNFI